MNWLVEAETLSFTFHAFGHPAVTSTHGTTIEITKVSNLSLKGDCVIAVKSSIGIQNLPTDLKKALSISGRRVRVVLRTGPFQLVVDGEGDPRLTFSHPRDLVIRKSGFISDRTLMIHADKSANDLPRGMVRLLQDPKNRLTIELCNF